MSEKRSQHAFTESSRRGFLGGVGAIVAAAAYTRDVPAAVAARVANDEDGAVQRVESPDGSIAVTVDVSDGVPSYEVGCNGTTYIEPSTLGFDFRNQPSFGASAEGEDGADLDVTGSDRTSATEEWKPVWGATDGVSAEYSALTVGLEETGDSGRGANLEVRVFDDGLGLRVILDEGFASNSDRAVVTSENTGVDFAGDYTAWWIRNEVTNPRFEQEYIESSLSEIPGGTRETRPTDTPMRNGAHTPLTIDADDVYLSVHESNLADYAAATLAPRSEDGEPSSQPNSRRCPTGRRPPWNCRRRRPGGRSRSGVRRATSWNPS